MVLLFIVVVCGGKVGMRKVTDTFGMHTYIQIGPEILQQSLKRDQHDPDGFQDTAMVEKSC